MKLSVALVAIPALAMMVNATESPKKEEPKKEEGVKAEAKVAGPKPEEIQAARDAKPIDPKYTLSKEDADKFAGLAKAFAVLASDEKKLKENKAGKTISTINAFITAVGADKLGNYLNETIADARVITQHKITKVHSFIVNLWYQVPEEIKAGKEEEKKAVERLLTYKKKWPAVLEEYSKKEGERYKAEVDGKSREERKEGEKTTSDFDQARKKYTPLELAGEIEIAYAVLDTLLVAAQLESAEFNKLRADILAKYSILADNLGHSATEHKTAKMRGNLKKAMEDAGKSAMEASSELLPIFQSRLLHIICAVIALLLIVGGISVFFLTK